MYSEEHEDPLYTKLSKILELTSVTAVRSSHMAEEKERDERAGLGFVV